MNGPLKGIKASELIKVLQKSIKEHGDLPVSAGGGDYPDGVQKDSVRYVEKGDGYVPSNSFHIL